MQFPTADSLLLWISVVITLLLNVSRIPSCHDGRDAEVRGAWPIGIAVVVEVVQYSRYAAVRRWRTGAAVVGVVAVARSWYSSNRCSRILIALHFPVTEEARAGRFLFGATFTTAARATVTATRLCRRLQSKSLPSGEGTRLEQHYQLTSVFIYPFYYHPTFFLTLLHSYIIPLYNYLHALAASLRLRDIILMSQMYSSVRSRRYSVTPADNAGAFLHFMQLKHHAYRYRNVRTFWWPAQTHILINFTLLIFIWYIK